MVNKFSDNIGIFCGTAGGTSMVVAEALAEAFDVEEDNLINMEEDFDDIEQFEEFDVLFIGSSTWGQGDVHFSWVDAEVEMQDEEVDLSSKTVAFFGAGDCKKHGEHFCSVTAFPMTVEPSWLFSRHRHAPVRLRIYPWVKSPDLLDPGVLRDCGVENPFSSLLISSFLFLLRLSYQFFSDGLRHLLIDGKFHRKLSLALCQTPEYR